MQTHTFIDSKSAKLAIEVILNMEISREKGAINKKVG